MNTANSVGRRPVSTRPPVFSSQMAFGPTWKKVISTAAPPIKRTISHNGDGLNRPFRKPLRRIAAGLKILQRTEATAMKAIIAVTIAIKVSPRTAGMTFAITATGMVRPPS